MSVKVIEVDVSSEEGIWTQALAGCRRAGHNLARGMVDFIEEVTGPTVMYLLKKAAGGLNWALGGHYRDEMEELAEVLDISTGDIMVANILYDIVAGGCSTFVVPTAEGPMHARNLDWVFPNKINRKHTTVIRFRNAPSGDYATVTWPGLFGVVTGVAPGRFSITINFCRHRNESGVWAAAKRAFKGYWPVMWVVRRVFDTENTFTGAVRYLEKAPIIAPVLFTVAGTKTGQGVVIERSPDNSSVRRMSNSPAGIFVTNHYMSKKFADDNVRIEAMDTVQRYVALGRRLLRGPLQGATEALGLLSNSSVLSDITQHQVVMRPSDGLLVVRVPGNRRVAVDLQN